MVKKVLIITSIFLIILSTGGFYVFKNTFLANQENALILSFIPFLIGVFIIIYREKVSQYFQNNTLKDNLYIGFSVLTIWSLWVIFSSVFLIHHTILWQDEWRHFDDYLFKKDFFHSIFDRQNGHLMYFPNLIFLGNYYLFAGKEVWLVLINMILYSVSGGISLIVLYNRLKDNLNKSISITCVIVFLLFYFWLANYVHLFWGIGVHNGLTILGAVIVAYTLSRKNISNPKAILNFILGATLASTSCGPGSAIWILAFIASIITKQKLKTIVTYFVIGASGGMATIGYHVLTSGGAFGNPSILTIIQATLTFLGAPFAIIIQPFLLSSQQVGYLAMTFGIFGMVFLFFDIFYYSNNHYSETLNANHPKNLNTNSTGSVNVFFQLLAIFIIVCGFLVSLGRVVDNIFFTLQPRYLSWSVLFWSSIFALAMLKISTINRIRVQRVLIGILLVFVFLGLNFSNATFVLNSLRGYNHITKAKLDLIVQPDTLGLEKNLWHGGLDRRYFREVVLKVSNKLKQEQKNIYTKPWTHWMNQKFSSLFTKNRAYTFHANFIISETQSDSSLVFKGFLKPQTNAVHFPNFLVAVKDDSIIGLGLPASSIESELNQSYIGLFGLIRFWMNPYALFPGISNYYLGQFNGQENVVIYGVYDDYSFVEISW